MWTYRFRRLYRGLAVPGWLAGVWGILERASVVAWLKEVWTSLSPKLAALSGYGLILSIVGFGWLAWLVIRKPRTIDLQEFASARGRDGLVLENEVITNRTIEGPATVYVDAGTIIRDNHFEGTSYAVVSDDQQVLYGAIGLRNCTIARCTIRKIGFVGNAATIAAIRAGIQHKD